MNGQFTQRGKNGKQMWMLYYPKLNDANDVSQTIVDGKPLCIFHRKLTHAHTHKYLRRSLCRRMNLHKPIEKGALVILHTHVTRYRAISPKEKETSI